MVLLAMMSILENFAQNLPFLDKPLVLFDRDL
jgi:hypothetical protein